MAFLKVGPLTALPPGAVAEVRAGGKTLVICNSGGEVRALDGVCPHAGGPLGHGAIHGDTIVCPFHAWEFDSRTGENCYGGGDSLAVYTVRIQDGQILVEVDSDAGTA